MSGEPSDAPDAISTRTFLGRKKVDPETGKFSNSEDAIPKSSFIHKKKVDPETGRPSDAADAIPLSTFSNRKKVDPKTGLSSDAPDAISYGAFQNRKKKVDPKTGKSSDASNAVLYSVYYANKKVDPKTGKPSDAEDAINNGAYLQRKRKQKNQSIDSAPRKRKRNDEIKDSPNKKARQDNISALQDKDLIENDSSLVMVFNAALVREIIAQQECLLKNNDPIMVEDENLQPITELNTEEFEKVAKILRGSSQAESNCAYLTECFLRYLLTSKIPTQPAPDEEASLKYFRVNYDKEPMPVQVKLEPDSLKSTINIPTTMTIYQSTIERNSSLGSLVPMGEIPQELNGVIDFTVPPTFDLDNYQQTSVLYSQLNAQLMREAKENGGYLFGMCNLGRCSRFVNRPSHMIAFYATDKDLIYIDCQNEKPLFKDLCTVFKFNQGKGTTIDTFGELVFYAPVSLLQEKMSLELPSSHSTQVLSDEQSMQIDEAHLAPVQIDTVEKSSSVLHASQKHTLFNQSSLIKTDNGKHSDFIEKSYSSR